MKLFVILFVVCLSSCNQRFYAEYEIHEEESGYSTKTKFVGESENQVSGKVHFLDTSMYVYLTFDKQSVLVYNREEYLVPKLEVTLDSIGRKQFYISINAKTFHFIELQSGKIIRDTSETIIPIEELNY